MRTLIERKFDQYPPLRFTVVLCFSISFLSSVSCVGEAEDTVAQNVVTVQCEVPGATPMEIAELVAIPYERVLEDARHVIRVSSESKPGIATIWVQFEENVAPLEARQIVATSLDQAFTSALAEDPIILASTSPRVLLLSAQLIEAEDEADRGGEMTFNLRSEVINDVVPKIQRIVGIADVRCIGGLEKRFLVEADMEQLTRFGLTIDIIENSIRQNWVGPMPNETGVLESNDESKGRGQIVESLEAIEIRTESGEQVRLGDVSTVKVDWQGVDERSQEGFAAGQIRHRDRMVLVMHMNPDADIDATTQEVNKLIAEMADEYKDSFIMSRKVDDDEFALLLVLAQQRAAERLPVGSSFERFGEGRFVSGFHERNKGRVVVRFHGAEQQTMREVAINMRELFLSMERVEHASIVPTELVPEIDVRLNAERAEELGVSHQDVAQVINDHFRGRTVLAMQQGRQTVEVVVTSQSSDDAEARFDDLKIRLEDGTAVPLDQLASIELIANLPAIYREDGHEVVYLVISAPDDVAQSELEELVREELSKVKSGFAEMGLEWSLREGE